jgi:Protein of unknown function (DUF3999)
MRQVILCVALLTSALTIAGRVAAQSTPQGRFAFERPVRTSGTGPHRLPVDHPLLTGGSPFRVVRRGQRFVAEDGLVDLRLFDATGRPVPHLLVHPRGGDPLWIIGRVLPVQPTRRTSGFEVDFGRSEVINTISVEGIPAPFLKRLSVEGSGDRARWTSLAPEATLFALPAEKLQQTQVGFSPGAYRYVRVIWNDANSGRVPLPRIVRARPAADLQFPAQPPIQLEFEQQVSEPGTSRYRVRLPAARLPIVALELDVAGGHVFRSGTVTESRFAGYEAAPVELGRRTLSRVVRDGIQAADLRIPISPPAETEIQLVIDDGSNLPLEIQRILGHLAELPVIYFESPPGDVIARYGDRTLKPPTYDLEAVRQSIDLNRVGEASWGDARARTETDAAPPDDGMPQPGGSVDPGGFRHVRSLSNASTGLVSLQLDAAVLAQSSGPARRFADVRVLEESNRQIPYLVERRDEPLELELALASAETQAVELTRAPGRQLSVYKLSLPYADLPPATLVLETSARVFQRSVQLGVERAADRNHRDSWFQVLASETWRHADRETPARGLSLRINPAGQTDLLLVVDEGDNAPLPVSAVRLLLPSYRLRYYQPPSGALRLVYGREDMQLPQYDLALLAQQVMGAPAQELTPGSEPTGAPGSTRREIVSPMTFWILLGAAVLVLVGLIAKLVRT